MSNPAPNSDWLSVEQIRKLHRCRREMVIAAMESGQLPYEQRGRTRYARRCDVDVWGESRLQKDAAAQPVRMQVHPALADIQLLTKDSLKNAVWFDPNGELNK